MNKILFVYLLTALGPAAGVWLALRPKPRETARQRLKTARRRLFGDPNDPARIEKARKRALKFKYAGMNETRVQMVCYACAVLFFGIYVYFSQNIIVAILYAFFGYQIPLLVVDIASTVNESRGFGQIADFISAFTDAREMKMTINDSLSAAGRAVKGPPLENDIKICLRKISLDSAAEQENLKVLGREINNHHLVNFADLVEQIKKSGVEDPKPFRMQDWVIQEEERLQEEFTQAIMAYMFFLAIFCVANLFSIPVMYFAAHPVWVTLTGMPVLMYLTAASGLFMMKGIRDYATKRVVI